jgi:hypothetical protein
MSRLMQGTLVLWIACNISAWFLVVQGNYGFAAMEGTLAFALMLAATDAEELLHD